MNFGSILKSRNVSAVLGELVVDDLNVTFSPHDDRTLGMDFIGHKVQNALDLAFEHTGGGDSSGLFDDHSHRNSFVQQSKLSLGGLDVGRVQVDSSVQNGTVDVGNHGSDISCCVRVLLVLEDLDGVLDGLIPSGGVTFVARKDLLSAGLREHHLHTGVNELSNGAVEAESVNIASSEGEDHLDGRGIGNISGADAFRSTSKDVFDSSVASRFALVDTENGTNTYIAVNVRTSVKGIEGDAKFTGLSSWNDDGFFVFFGYQDRADSRVDEGVDHHVVRKNIEFLLVISGTVLLSGKTVEVGNTGTLNGRCDELARRGNSIHQDNKVVIMGGGHDEPVEGGGVDIELFGHFVGFYCCVVY